MNALLGGEHKYTLFDFFDRDRANPVQLSFKEPLKEKDTFDADGVTYEVVDLDRNIFKDVAYAIIQMTRYRIASTSTQFVHKCPAKKSAMDALGRDDVIKLEAQVGKKTLAQWTKGRVKMKGHTLYEQKCPFCKVVFWKEALKMPEEVTVDGVMNKRKPKAKKSKSRVKAKPKSKTKGKRK